MNFLLHWLFTYTSTLGKVKSAIDNELILDEDIGGAVGSYAAQTSQFNKAPSVIPHFR